MWWNPGIKNPIKQRPLHNEHYYSTAFSRVQITCTQNEYKYPTVFVLQKTSLTVFLQMSHQALGLQGEGWKNGWNPPFFLKKTMNAYQILRFPETSNDIDDSEIYLFIVQNRTGIRQKRQKLTSSPLKKQRPLKKFPPRNLTIFYVICLSKSGDGTHLFSGAVFNKCTIVVGQKSPLQSHPKWRVAIDLHEDDWAWSSFGLLTSCCLTLFDLTFEFCLFCQVLSFRSFTRWPRTLLLIWL